jgi:hypothetical protein
MALLDELVRQRAKRCERRVAPTVGQRGLDELRDLVAPVTLSKPRSMNMLVAASEMNVRGGGSPGALR